MNPFAPKTAHFVPLISDDSIIISSINKAVKLLTNFGAKKFLGNGYLMSGQKKVLKWDFCTYLTLGASDPLTNINLLFLGPSYTYPPSFRSKTHRFWLICLLPMENFATFLYFLSFFSKHLSYSVIAHKFCHQK